MFLLGEKWSRGSANDVALCLSGCCSLARSATFGSLFSLWEMSCQARTEKPELCFDCENTNECRVSTYASFAQEPPVVTLSLSFVLSCTWQGRQVHDMCVFCSVSLNKLCFFFESVYSPVFLFWLLQTVSIMWDIRACFFFSSSLSPHVPCRVFSYHFVSRQSNAKWTYHRAWFHRKHPLHALFVCKTCRLCRRSWIRFFHEAKAKLTATFNHKTSHKPNKTGPDMQLKSCQRRSLFGESIILL